MNFAKWLTILFIGLKLTQHISWSWWLIALPFALNVVFEIFGNGIKAYKEEKAKAEQELKDIMTKTFGRV